MPGPEDTKQSKIIASIKEFFASIRLVLTQSNGTTVDALGESGGQLATSLYGHDSAGNPDQLRTNANEQLQVEVVRGTNKGVLGTSDPAATTNTNLYTPATLTETQITTFTACNRSAATVTVRVGIDVGGNGTNAPSDAEWIYYDLPIAGNSTLVFDAAQGMWLGPLDDLVVYASASDMSFVATGVEHA